MPFDTIIKKCQALQRCETHNVNIHALRSPVMGELSTVYLENCNMSNNQSFILPHLDILPFCFTVTLNITELSSTISHIVNIITRPHFRATILRQRHQPYGYGYNNCWNHCDSVGNNSCHSRIAFFKKVCFYLQSNYSQVASLKDIEVPTQ